MVVVIKASHCSSMLGRIAAEIADSRRRRLSKAPEMQLYYFKDRWGNFGDDLNPWLWRQLLPEALQGDPDELLVGIGTLLNHRLSAAPLKHVFGSGYGYGRKPVIDGRWRFHAVRGYGTARALGLPKDTVITDAALLVRAVRGPRQVQATQRFGFIPHCHSHLWFDWSAVCNQLGFHHIDVRWDVERVMAEMSQCEVLICEAMHGAIVADALRIPWIPVSCYADTSDFKWCDWLSTVELPYAPTRVTSLFDAERRLNVRARLKNQVKRSLQGAGLWSARWTEPPPRRTGEAELHAALLQLEQASRGRTFLSSDAILQRHLQRYLEKLDLLRRDLRHRQRDQSVVATSVSYGGVSQMLGPRRLAHDA
jgi:succinoglycan biosynthesis protein ExoV